ncbi:NAD-dependent DNA ligase LigA (plasmid) [Streptomyces sp. NBC_00637]|uniref:NAD-dependent DNA ligase LigA n=1 Tax=Streptomyces sp. NBC_00637 TaxID=2903667 RepID=UPI002F913F5D
MTTALAAPLADVTEYNSAIDTALSAAAAYYGDGDTTLDDASYDALVVRIADFERVHPEHTRADSPTGKVGGGAAPVGDVPHTVPMLSLDNVFGEEDLLKWGASVARRLDAAVTGGYTSEPKLDGAAVAGRYVNGRLVKLVGRGDGSHGEDLSHAIGTIVGLPEQLSVDATFEVRGEVLLTRAQFEQANEIRAAHNAKPFANARNGTAGTLRAKDRPYVIETTFFAYGAVTLDVDFLRGDTHEEVMAQIAALGIQTTAATDVGLRVYGTLQEVQARVEEIERLRADLPFGIDGVVVKLNSFAEQATAGFATRHPHWATAYKLKPVERQTKLLSVEWNVGRTRIIAPRAVLEPVEVDGSTVEYATLHNPSFILKSGMMIGDTVTVFKAGDVIPRVEAPVVAARTGSETPIVFPEVCPTCKGTIDKSGERWECADPASSCGLLASLEYAVAREKFDIDGLGTTFLKALVASGAVADVGDLFRLTREQLAEAARSEKRADTLLAQIEQAKKQPLSRVFCGLGIVRTGRTLARQIARHFGTMEAIRAASVKELAAVPKLPPANAPKIAAHIAAMGPVIDKLVEAGVNMEEPQTANSSGPKPLTGETVVVTGGMTGPLAGRNRDQMRELIENAGGTSSSSVSRKTTILVAGEGAGSKVAKAQGLGTTILTEQEFADRISDVLA